jgi:hypothetical protein
VDTDVVCFSDKYNVLIRVCTVLRRWLRRLYEHSIFAFDNDLANYLLIVDF